MNIEFELNTLENKEVQRKPQSYTLNDVTHVAENEHGDAIDLPAFWRMVNENSKLCDTPETPSSEIVSAVSNINVLIDQHKEDFLELENRTKERNQKILDILRKFADKNLQASPYLAFSVINFQFKNSKGAGRLDVNICEEINKPIKNLLVIENDSVNNS